MSPERRVNPEKRRHEPYLISALFALIGPVIWALHYALVYFIQRRLCNGYAAASVSEFVATIIAMATAVMTIFLVAMIIHAPRLNKLFKTAKKAGMSHCRLNPPSKRVGRWLNAGIRVLLGACILGVLKTSTSLMHVGDCGALFGRVFI